MGQGVGAKDQMARAVEEAERALAATYWSACDALKAAIDPATLTHVAWARAYPAELHEVALSIEADPAPWEEVRKLISAPDWYIAATTNVDILYRSGQCLSCPIGKSVRS